MCCENARAIAGQAGMVLSQDLNRMAQVRRYYLGTITRNRKCNLK